MIEEQTHENKDSPLQNILQSLKSKEISPRFNHHLYAFIKTAPGKKDIQAVSIAIQKCKKESLHYHEVTDLLIIILKLLLNISRQEEYQKCEDKFREKCELLREKLKKEEIIKWVKGLKDEITRLVFNRVDEKEKNKLEQEYLNVSLKKAKQERDQANEKYKKIALSFFNFSEVELRWSSGEFQKDLQRQVAKIKEKITVLEEEAKKNSELITNLLSLSKRNGLTCTKSEQALEGVQKLLMDLKVKNKIMQTKIATLQAKEVKKEDNIANLSYKVETFEGQRKVCKQKMVELGYNSEEAITKAFLLTSQIIKEEHYPQVVFLRKSMKEISGVDGISCKLLYSSNQHRSQKVHDLIDNHPNMLLLVKLKNGAIIGGFSCEQLKPKCNDTKGFIFSLTQSQAYERVQRSTIAYDETYIIFGNSQICIKLTGMNLFSNFGIQARCFNNKGRNVAFFLGNEGRREVEMDVYEVFQVMAE